jgi:ribosomal protein S18 acetylase RimI-like enzyme
MLRLMAIVLQMRVDMEFRPELPPVHGVTVRSFAGPQDVEAWLEIRHRAFAREKVGVRQWAAADFEAEFLAKPWWSPELLWFAETAADAQNPSRPIGTVARALRGAGPEARPVVHWLSVLPAWRRRGIGRLLLTQLHRSCWDAGYRQIWLETHSQWQAAVHLYRELGYREVRRESGS